MSRKVASAPSVPLVEIERESPLRLEGVFQRATNPRNDILMTVAGIDQDISYGVQEFRK